MDTFIKPLVAALIMGGAAYFSYSWIYARIPSNTIATASAIFIGVVLYLVGILAMHTFSEDDLAYIPGGSILAKLQFRHR